MEAVGAGAQAFKNQIMAGKDLILINAGLVYGTGSSSKKMMQPCEGFTGKTLKIDRWGRLSEEPSQGYHLRFKMIQYRVYHIFVFLILLSYNISWSRFD